MWKPLRRLPVLVFVLLAPELAAQNPLQEFQRAVLHGDAKPARKTLGKMAVDTPTRAVLQSASLPIAERAMALAQIVRIYPDHAIADIAIVAGCAALLSSQGIRADLRPGIASRVFRFSGLAVTYKWDGGTGGGEVRRIEATTAATLATRIRKEGFPEVWSAKEQPLVRTLLRRRGILPAPR